MKYLITGLLLSVVLFIGYPLVCFVEVILLPDELVTIEERFPNPVTAHTIRQDNLGNCSYQKVGSTRRTVCQKPQHEVSLQVFNQFAADGEVYYSAPSTFYNWGAYAVYLLPLPDRVLQVNLPLVVSKAQYVRGKLFTLTYTPASVRIEANGDLTLVSYASSNAQVRGILAGIFLVTFFSTGWTGIYLGNKKKRG